MPPVNSSTGMEGAGRRGAVRGSSAALEQPVSPVGHALPCSCGSRVPLGVRLHLRSRTRPVFEGRWCCSPACLQSRVSAAVRRETRKVLPGPPHQPRVPLGLMLLSAGRVTHAALQHALEVQRKTGERIGEVLIRECGVSERAVAEALTVQWSCPVWDVSGLLPSRVAPLAPRRVLQRGGILPLRLSHEADGAAAPPARERRLSVAFPGAIDSQAVFALRRMHDIAVDAGIAPITPWTEAHRRLLATDGVRCQEVACSSTADLEQQAILALRRLQPVESRWVRLHELHWMRLWLEPAARLGGPEQRDDVLDFVFHLPAGGME